MRQFDPSAFSRCGWFSSNHDLDLSLPNTRITNNLFLVDQTDMEQDVYQGACSDRYLPVFCIRLIDFDQYSNGAVREKGLTFLNDLPSCGGYCGNELVKQMLPLVISGDPSNTEFLTMKRKQGGRDFCLLLWRKASRNLLIAKLSECLFRFYGLPLQSGRFSIATFIFLLLFLSPLAGRSAVGSFNQNILSQSVYVGYDLAYSQQKQADNSEPKIEIAPPRGATYGVPARHQTHDIAPILLALFAAFLLGFKVSSWVHRRIMVLPPNPPTP